MDTRWLVEEVVKTSEHVLFKVSDLLGGVSIGSDVGEFLDGRRVDLFVLCGQEERCDSHKLQFGLGDFLNLGEGEGEEGRVKLLLLSLEARPRL